MLQKISFEDLAKILFTPFVHISHENTKIAIIAGRAEHLYKAIFLFVRTGNRPFTESLVNNASE